MHRSAAETLLESTSESDYIEGRSYSWPNAKLLLIIYGIDPSLNRRCKVSPSGSDSQGRRCFGGAGEASWLLGLASRGGGVPSQVDVSVFRHFRGCSHPTWQLQRESAVSGGGRAIKSSHISTLVRLTYSGRVFQSLSQFWISWLLSCQKRRR